LARSRETALHPRATEVPVIASEPLYARRSAFATVDAERAREFIRHAYGVRFLVTGPARGGLRISLTHSDTGSFAVADFTLSASLSFAVDDSPAAVITTLTAGTGQAEQGKAVDRFQPGDLFLSSAPDLRYRGQAHGVVSRSFVLPLRAFDGVLGPERATPLRFLAQRPADAAARIRWGHAARFIDNLLANPDAAGNQLVAGSAARMLAAVALDTFPNHAVASLAAADRRDAHPETLRRAVSFIEVNAGHDVTVADIAATAHVSVRAVQLAFRRHLDTTPMAYLQQVRLERARAELLAADSRRETVTALALRWGFSSPSRFSALYRRAYGTVPSKTLHQG
jgi:AraC-like DNA-binding protein